ncbi:MAG: hypothetical protein CMO80_01285 [Verrucomicrobiales bacterium]|nr:hypothetical protein [Verrucomicrobiales bacterium]
MQFALRDQATAGNPVSTVLRLNNVGVTNGIFQATLDFGTNVWNGAARWLGISVRNAGSQAAFTLLVPSQQVP